MDILNLFSSTQLQLLLLAGVITSLIVSAVNVIQTKADGTAPIPGVLVAVAAAIVITLLQVSFKAGQSLDQWQASITAALLTLAFAVVFWSCAGRYLIDPAFAWLKKWIAEKLGITLN